ncbi:hypothetical protein CXF46_08605 [Corynebacterium bovis]|nr:hypothetical protein CXF38_10335 [Corynebacterium bovis]WJY78411.1 hypothetical protein CBOVI_09625 [Corynebacterium bovis DSM 20582 = CIP 54.80]RRO79992.1 hypothetical protein CXF36_09250 [Corynebacterium bovis]RRO80659.1 hypothetical protein CXF37_08585 [Corynebacterium bovis]RRO88047.1 hypothetical protein CXF45_09980 [Corynebacterium bovis]
MAGRRARGRSDFSAPIDEVAPLSYSMMFIHGDFDTVCEAAEYLSLSPADEERAPSDWSVREHWRDRVGDDWVREFRLAEDPRYPGFGTLIQTANPRWIAWIGASYQYVDRIDGRLQSTVARQVVPDYEIVLVNRYPDGEYLAESIPGWQHNWRSRIEFWDSETFIRYQNFDRGWRKIGLELSQSWRLQPVTDWLEGPEYAFPGMEKLRSKKGPLRARFGDEELAAAAAVFGIDLFSKEFYCGPAVTFGVSALADKEFGVADAEQYRDLFLPGWREDPGRGCVRW